MTRKTDRFPNLDALRLVLAIDVVLHHAYTLVGGRHYSDLLFAVPTFVCLSGFLIPGSLSSSESKYGHQRGWRHFAWKRILRVYPAMLCSLALVALLHGPGKLWPTLVGYLAMGLIVTGTANGALWSLMLEECLYAFHVLSRKVQIFTPMVLVLLIALGVEIQMTKPTPQVDSIVSAANAFFAGCLLYMNREKLDRIHWVWPLLVLPGALVAYYGGLATGIHLKDAYFVLRCLVSVSLVVLAYRLPQIKAKKWVDLSYGVYVYHVPILLAVAGLGLAWGSTFALTVGIVLAAAYLSYRFVEEPCLKAKERLPQWPRKVKGEAIQATEAVA